MQLLIGLLAVSFCCILSNAAESDDFVRAHNEARAAVRVGPVTWNTTVAQYAQKYVGVLRDQYNCRLVHSNGRYGENLFWGSPRRTPANVVKAWVAERANYHYNTNTCDQGKVCGHYTQVVWSRSVRIGCASLLCRDGISYVVSCNYDPPGNIIGQRPYAQDTVDWMDV